MTTTYLFDKSNNTHILFMQRQATSIIKSFFIKYDALIGKPRFIIKTDKIIVQIYYYNKNKIIENANLNILGKSLTRCWGRNVELRLIGLNYAVLDSSIFTQYLSVNSKKYSFNQLFNMIKSKLPTIVEDKLFQQSLSKNSSKDLSSIISDNFYIKSRITGLRIKLSGRLITQPSRPRQTTNVNRLGSSAKGLYGSTDFSKYTSKNKLGAFTMKVWINQHSL